MNCAEADRVIRDETIETEDRRVVEAFDHMGFCERCLRDDPKLKRSFKAVAEGHREYVKTLN